MYDPYPLDYPIKEELIKYSNDVIKGNITACQKHKWACMRFLRDLEREGTEEFPFLFDKEKAILFFNWMMLFKHTKGPLAGKRKIPEPIEKFVFGNVYGWVYRDTGYRRFRQAYWQVGRKNAKSQDLAIVGLYEMSAIGESNAEIYVAATKKEQTKYVWGEADTIYRRCDELKNKFKTSYGVIKHPKSDSVFARLSKEDKKQGDGGNPQCGILDEYHAHETDEYYNLLTSGMKTRTQPLLIIITTAGFDLSNPCYTDEYDYVSKILNPDINIENDRYFVMINELDKDDDGNLIDDIKDERCWIKANPILAKTKEGIESIRAELQIALDKPEKMRDLLTKTMDVWVDQRSQGYMNMARWAQCGAAESNQYPNVAGLPVISGVDLSTTTDLTSVSFEIQLDDSRLATMSHSFIPQDKFKEKINVDKVPYDLWEKQEWLTVTPGAVVDYNFVLKYIEDTYKKYNWVKGEVCFDRALATWLMTQLENRGFTPIEIPQGMLTLSEPTKDFRTLAYSKKIIHDNNPVLTWALSNAVTRKDHNENIMLDKSKSRERIDPAAAMMNAHVRAISKFKLVEEDIFYSPET